MGLDGGITMPKSRSLYITTLVALFAAIALTIDGCTGDSTNEAATSEPVTTGVKGYLASRINASPGADISVKPTTVGAYRIDDPDRTAVATTTSAEDGFYELVLPPGSYGIGVLQNDGKVCDVQPERNNTIAEVKAGQVLDHGLTGGVCNTKES